MTVILEKGWKDLTIETDCKTAANMVQDDALGTLAEDDRFLLQTLQSSTFWGKQISVWILSQRLNQNKNKILVVIENTPSLLGGLIL